jgi:hypothetical protein
VVGSRCVSSLDIDAVMDGETVVKGAKEVVDAEAAERRSVIDS